MDKQTTHEMGRKIMILSAFIGVAILFWVIVWIPFVHESFHALVCRLGGYEASISLNLVQQSNLCNDAGATYDFVFLRIIAPYLLDLMTIIVFTLSSPKKTLFNIIPYAAFMDIVMTFLVQPLGPNNDFVLIAENLPRVYYWLAVSLFPAALLLFYLYYKKVKDTWKSKTLEDFSLKFAKK